MTDEDLFHPLNGWAGPGSVRLPPPPPRQRGWMLRGLAGAARLFGRPALPDIFPVLNRHRRLFWPWLLFASQMMPFGRLPAATREKIILRVAWNTRSRYEWGQHLDLALRAGVSDADIVALTSEAVALSGKPDHLLVSLCDQLCADQPIDAQAWAAFCKAYGEVEQIELIMLVGHYRMIAGLLINAGIALEGPVEKVLKEFEQRQSIPVA